MLHVFAAGRFWIIAIWIFSHICGQLSQPSKNNIDKVLRIPLRVRDFLLHRQDETDTQSGVPLKIDCKRKPDELSHSRYTGCENEHSKKPQKEIEIMGPKLQN